MYTTEVTMDEIRIVSDEDLGVAAGGFRLLRLDGGGGGGVHASAPRITGPIGGQSDNNSLSHVLGAVVATAIFVAMFW